MAWEKGNRSSFPNGNVLNELSDSNGKLYYKGQPVSLGTSGSVSSNKYEGKWFYSFGDSITDGSEGEGTSYPMLTAQKLGMNLVNYGSGGSNTTRLRSIVCGLSGYSEPNYSNSALAFATIMIGHNQGTKQPLSTMDDINGITDYTLYPDTFYGNVCASIEHMITRNKGIKIFLLTPIQSLNGAHQQQGGEAAEAFYEIGRRYAVPVIDLRYISGLNAFNLTTYTNDSTHPNAKGNEKISSVLASQLLTY